MVRKQIQFTILLKLEVRKPRSKKSIHHSVKPADSEDIDLMHLMGGLP